MRSILTCETDTGTTVEGDGMILKKRIRESFNQGMETSDNRYNNYNKIFHKYYWSNEVNNYLDKLYYSGCIIPIQPLSTKSVL